MANHHPEERQYNGVYTPRSPPGPTPNDPRGMAFANIFGENPRLQERGGGGGGGGGGGRSQTMTNSSRPPPQFHPRPHDGYGSRTMTSETQRGFAAYQQPQYQPNGYGGNAPNGYAQQQQPNAPPQPRYRPQPMGEQRRGPIRVGDPYQQRPPQPPYGGQGMNDDQGRSKSLASYEPPRFNQFRGGEASHGSVTAAGRVVPRMDDRSMSLTSSKGSSRAAMETIITGRVIPRVRKDSNESSSQKPMQQYRTQTMPNRADFNPMKQRTPSQASNESAKTMRAPSMTSATPSFDSDGTLVNRSSGQSMTGQNGVPPIVTASRRSPLVYPALLSRVADAFKERINLGDRVKNGLESKNAFTGAEGVDLIAYIIKTTDRNLALLLGRALDAQKFFHDVTYDHRIRDSHSEIYQFKDGLIDEAHEVNGVFTLLTDCYSPTCTPTQLCYSIACPRRLEQQARLNMKPQPGLKRQDSRSSLHAEDEKEQKLWIHSVPKEVADSVSDKEKKRQEVIMEVIYTERDFVKDLEYLRDFWIKPLHSANPQNPSPIPEHRREKFIRTVFGNVLEVHGVNSRLADALTRRQQEAPVVRNVGDVFLEYIPLFEPFIKYGSNQLNGKIEFEKEKSNNPAFAKFVEETERMKESRKLELNGYLTKPTTRLARYPLLLEAVLKPTTEDNPDKTDIPKCVELIREFLTKVNIESGKAENLHNLRELDQKLVWRPGEHVDLKLSEEGRQFVYKGILKKGEAGGDIQTFLFDHALLLVRIKVVNKKEQFKVIKKPIPLELLVIAEMADVIPNAMGTIVKRPSSGLLPGAKNNANNKDDYNAKEKGYPITFQHLGKRGYTITLFAGSLVSRRKWIEHIEAQQAVLRERSNIFTRSVLSEGFFSAVNRVNCLVPIDGGRKLVYGTDSGIYVSERKPRDQTSAAPKKVIEINKVDQLDVLEEFAMLLLLSEKTLMQVPVEGLDPNDMTLANKRPKKIQGHTNFFKSGVCLGRVLVCSVRTSSLSSTVKVLEPQDTMSRGKKQPAFRKLLQGGQDALKPFKEFYIPTESSSIHFLKSKLCVGCAKGFEVVSMETLETQSLLDPADTSLDFVQRKENVKPIAIYRINGEFLLNYSDFSFFVNRNGWRARPEWQIHWEGQPTAFALSYPYILAFEPSFIEIRHVESGNLVTIVTGKNIRRLHESTREIIYAYEDDGSADDVIASLDFWSRNGTGG